MSRGNNTPQPFTQDWFKELGLPGIKTRKDVEVFLSGLGPSSLSDDREHTESILRQNGYVSRAECEKELRKVKKEAGRKTGPSKKGAVNVTGSRQHVHLEAIKRLLNGTCYPPEYQAKKEDPVATDVYKGAEQALTVVRRFYQMCTEGAFFTLALQTSLNRVQVVQPEYRLYGTDLESWNSAMRLLHEGTHYTQSKFIVECLGGVEFEKGLESYKRVQQVASELEDFFGCEFRDQNAALETLETHLCHCLNVVHESNYVKAADFASVYKWGFPTDLYESNFESRGDPDTSRPVPPEACSFRRAVRGLFYSVQKEQKSVFPTKPKIWENVDETDDIRAFRIRECLSVPYEMRKEYPADLIAFIASTVAALRAIQELTANRDAESAAESFDELFSMVVEDGKTALTEARRLREVYKTKTLDEVIEMSEKWMSFSDLLNGSYTPEEIHTAVKEVEEGISKAIRKLQKMGTLPTGVLLSSWERYCELNPDPGSET